MTTTQPQARREALILSLILLQPSAKRIRQLQTDLAGGRWQSRGRA